MIGIYKITNLINGKSYIGQSVHIERRWQEHCRPSAKSLIGKAIQKYGADNFSFQVLEECPQQLLDELEELYIKEYDSITPNGYNIMDWNEGTPTYYTTDKEELSKIIADIQGNLLTLDEIGEKYGISRRTVTRINLGHTHYSPEFTYPLRPQPKAEQKYCIDCGAPITSKAIRCVSCSKKAQRTTERPSRERLKELIRTTPFTQLGKMFGVTDNAVRKWCRAYGLPSKVAEIKTISDEDWIHI